MIVPGFSCNQSSTNIRLIVTRAFVAILFLYSYNSYSQQKKTRLKTFTFNIWYDNDHNNWEERKDKVVKVINDLDADVFGLQEVLYSQLQFINEFFPDYSYYGIGRLDGKLKGEFAPVFYKNERFELTTSGTFWLSENPQMPGSKSWDAACERIATWTILRDKKIQDYNQSFILFINTHFDHMGDTARLKSAQIIKEFLADQKSHFILKNIILTGDFNFTPGSQAHEIITDTLSGLIDTRTAGRRKSGKDYTYVGSDFTGKAGDIIDYVFINEGFNIKKYRIIEENWGNFYPSDHLPVSVELEYKSVSDN